MSHVETTSGTATVRLDSYSSRRTGAGQEQHSYQPDDLLVATSQALRAVGDQRADAVQALLVRS